MRFSSVFFQPATPPSEAQVEEAQREPAQPLAAPAQDLPEDLDARVRMLGEWQLGEA